MIIPTVLGSVAAIFASILQYQNGGLLNVFMKPVPPIDGQSEISFEPQQDPTVISTHFANIVWGKLSESDLAVLAALPENVGGGDKAVAKAIANPNLEGQIIITFIVCLVLASLGLLVIFIFSFLYCCCCSSGCHGDDDGEKNASIKDQNFICCTLHLFVFIITTVLLIGLAVCIGYYFGAAKILSETMADSQVSDEEVAVWLAGNSTSFSVGRIMRFCVSHIVKFGDSSIASAKTNINTTVTTLKDALVKETLPAEISTLVVAVLTQFEVDKIEKAVNYMAYVVGNAATNSRYISDNNPTKLTPITAKSQELERILTSIKTQCAISHAEVDAVKHEFLVTEVKTVPPTVTATLQKADQQLGDIKAKLNSVKQKLNDMQDVVFGQLNDKLNFTEILDGMNKLIGSLEQQFNEFSVQMDNMTTQVSGYLGQYSGSVNAGLYALGLPCILAGILFLVFLVLFLLEAIQRHQFSITGESASEVNGDKSPRTCVSGGGMFCICSVLLIVPIILVGLAAVVTVTVGGLLHAELCPYIGNTSGIQMTDYVANSKMQDVWDNVVLPQVSGGEGNKFEDILNLKAPQNPLQAIVIGCNPQNGKPTSKLGLLAQMGIDNLVNVNAFVESPLLTDGIQKAKESLVQNIADANLDKEIPDPNEFKVLTDGVKLVLEKLELKKSINYLETHYFNLDGIQALAKKIASSCPPQSGELDALVPSLKDCNADITEMYSAYKCLDGNATAIDSTDLVNGINSFKGATKDKPSVEKALTPPLDDFTRAVLGSVKKTGNEAFKNLTQNLLPCGSLYYAFDSVVFMSCGASGLAPRIFAWGLFLALCLFFTFFSLLSLCMLWRVQNHQAKRFANSLDRSSGFSRDE